MILIFLIISINGHIPVKLIPLTMRRHYLDKCLSKMAFQGKVMDIGGKKDNKRGAFRPPLDKVEEWHYCNIDSDTFPDFECSAESIPVENESYNQVVSCEVLEHLENPIQVLKEACRILKPKGDLILTMPFLVPIHADPFDFQRWTDFKLKSELEDLEFINIDIQPMGGIFAVMYDNLYMFNNQNTVGQKIARKFLKILSPLILCLDAKVRYKNKITTGWCVVAKKK